LGSVSVFTPGFLIELFTGNFTRLFRCIVDGVKYHSRASWVTQLQFLEFLVECHSKDMGVIALFWKQTLS